MKKIHIADHTESSMTPVLWADAVMSNMSAWWRLLSDHGYMKCFTDLLNSLHIHIKCSLFFTWVCLGHKSLRVSALKFCVRVSQALKKLLKSFCLPAYSNTLFSFPNRYHHTGWLTSDDNTQETHSVLLILSACCQQHQIYALKINWALPPKSFVSPVRRLQWFNLSPSFSEQQMDPVTSLQVCRRVQCGQRKNRQSAWCNIPSCRGIYLWPLLTGEIITV